MQLHQFTFFIAVVLAGASAHIGGEASRQELTQNYCGRNLAQALAMICDDIKPLKRSNAGMYSAILAPYYREQELQGARRDDEWPWMVPYKAKDMSGQRGKRQLIVSECCDKACSISELLTYC